MPRSPRLTTRFKQNVLKATADGAVVVDDVRELDGLSSGQIGAAAQAAAARGLGGKWLIALQNTTNQPLLAQLTNRALRERIYKASIGRALGGPTDNTAGDRAAGPAARRARGAARLSDPCRLSARGRVGRHAAGGARHDQPGGAGGAGAGARRGRDIQKLIDAEQAGARARPSFTLQPWDWSFYSEQVRKARYDFDQARWHRTSSWTACSRTGCSSPRTSCTA